jgi:hypothetical protein
MSCWFNRLCLVAMSLYFVGMAILSGETLPSASGVEQAGAAALSFGLTFGDLCSPW